MNSILKLIYRNYKKQPNNVAIVDENGSFTWKELFDYAYAIATKLLKNEIKKQDCVSVELPNCKEFIASIIACQIIGAVYVPVGNAYPEERIKFIRKDCDVKAAINKEFVDNLDVKNTKDVKSVDKDDEDIEMIIYTSGSTGKPKGVIHNVKSFYRAITGMHNKFTNLSVNDTIANIAPLNFILGMQSCFSVVSYSCMNLKLAIIDKKILKNVDNFLKILNKFNVNKISMSPELLSLFIDKKTPIKKVYVGGSNVRNSYYKNIKVYNSYGSTELGGGSFFFEIDKNYESTPIGDIFPGLSYYILDKYFNETDKGELCISGDIALGYLNDDKITNDKFISNPFFERDGHKRLFKTGDIVKKEPNGNIIIIGRKDFMVNINGQRVELEEIDYRLNKISGIVKSAVKKIEHRDNSFLVAYYTSEIDLSDDFIKKELSKNLADYMIPSFYIKLDEMPMLPNGKINRQALPKFDISSSQKKYIAPSNDIEKDICNAFAKVFNLEQVGTTDDFIVLGGNSLTAMKLQADIQKKYNVAISSSEILALATPKHISENIKDYLASSDNLQLNNLNKYSFNDTVPLSESQLNVYLDEISHQKNTAYNNPIKIHFTKYNKLEIKNAVQKLIHQHPILKARIYNSLGNPCLKFDAHVEIKEINNSKDFVRPFVLDKSLSRFSLIENQKSIDLYIDIHHIITDGESMHILGVHLMRSLHKQNKNISIDTGILRSLEYEELAKKNNKYKKIKLFFEKMLCDSDEVDDLIESVNNNNAGTIEETLSIDINALNKFMKDKKITLNQYLISVFAYTLTRFTGSGKALFCIVENGRGNLNLDNSVGMFVKTLPLLIDCEDKDVSDYLNSTKELINNSIKYDFYPFRLLSKKYNIEYNISFQYSHDIRKISYKTFDFEELDHDLVEDLSINVFNDDNNLLQIKVEHNKKYSDELCKSLISVYKKIMTQFMCCKKLSEINYTSEEDLTFFNNLNKTEKELKCNDILEAFNNSLKKLPNNILVAYKDIKFTYYEGAVWINSLANVLHDVSIESNIAILINRSHYYLLSVLGVLNLGCAYVPIDDTYPDERIEFILKDCKPACVLVSDKTIERAKSITDARLVNISNIKTINHNSNKMFSLC